MLIEPINFPAWDSSQRDLWLSATVLSSWDLQYRVCVAKSQDDLLDGEAADRAPQLKLHPSARFRRSPILPGNRCWEDRQLPLLLRPTRVELSA